jgi:anti-sigma-K factor RskA
MSDVRGHAAWLERATIAALGALDADERSAFARHLREGCTPCLAELREAERTVAALAALPPPVPAPVALRERLRASAGRGTPARPRETAPASPGRARRWLGPAARAAAAAVVALLALRAAGTLERERVLRHQAEPALARAESAAQASERERDRLVALVETVAAPSARAVVLAGAETVRSARGRAFVEPVGQRIVLLVHDLPPPPPGRTYQLWTIEGGVPASAGTFATSDAGVARHATATPARLGSTIVLAVTVEPEGGLPQPSGPIVMAQR